MPPLFTVRPLPALARRLLSLLACAGLLTAPHARAAASAAFTIEPRLLGRTLSAAQRATVQEAAARVSALIASPFVPVRLDAPAGDCDQGLPRLRETARQFVVFVIVKNLEDDLYATGMPCDLRDGSFLPMYGTIELNSDGLNDLPRADLLDTMIHEFLHTLGMGTLWEAEYRVSVSGDSDGRTFVRRIGRQLYYTGPRALAAYRALGGREVGVPLDPDAGHWAGGAVCSEILSGSAGEFTGRVNPVSPLTLGALEDLGYRVNRAAGAPFRLPTGRSCATQVTPKPGAPQARPPAVFSSCAAARAAGATLPLRRGQPGYRPELDGDRDGLACENRP
ncbi:excalibur calcium-binding domain-containing protein [Deinococcus knuensis]|uniref:Excalibur calcium-binding domain-containing protein n=1 Tax=Deinococcus knuensis TaxID=1837380 RepID=A0ABQ2S9Z4_9DEIO|nr:excalibur calcium-binding domain-containing protein [Deinococcus knuensis]GGS13402.1 hypothetical protein GCM10008961_00620 [Deinococcus knuensis]